MNSRTEGEFCAFAAQLDPDMPPAQGALRAAAYLNAMMAGAAPYSRETFVRVMAICDVTISAIDRHAAAWVTFPEGQEAGLT